MSAALATPKPVRLLQLDVLRGIAVLLVMGYHLPALPILSNAGYLGVDLFFVLSGFLVSGLLFREIQSTGGVNLSRFYLRRALKIYPSVYLLLALTYLLFTAALGWAQVSNTALGDLLLSQNYLGGLWGHTWSLAVEEHFYLLLPVTLILLLGLRTRTARDPLGLLPYAFGLIMLVSVALRVQNARCFPVFDVQRHIVPSHLRFDGLFFGVFLSFLHHFRPHLLRILMTRPYRFPITALGLALLIPLLLLPAEHVFTYTLGFVCAYLAFGTLLLVALYPERPTVIEPGGATRFLGWLGAYSYTIYLWHIPVLSALRYGGPKLGLALTLLAYYAGSIAVGVGASKLVEMPVLRLRDRLFPSRANWPSSDSQDDVAAGFPPESFQRLRALDHEASRQ